MSSEICFLYKQIFYYPNGIYLQHIITFFTFTFFIKFSTLTEGLPNDAAASREGM